MACCRGTRALVACFLITLVAAARAGTSGHRNTHQRAIRAESVELSLRKLLRCRGVRGPACALYYAQSLEQQRPPRVYSAPCGSGSSCGLGVCHADTGLCDCPAGVGGPDCSLPDLRPCTNGYRTDMHSKEATSHIGPNKRDLNWSAPGYTPSRCAGVCDDATATCFCDGAHFGRVPALPDSPPGTAPIRPGRLLHGNCQRPMTGPAGQRLPWGNGGVTYDDIYGAQGWCTVDTPRMRCSCDLDGYDGQLCEAVTETVCPNQCSGHGECLRGFCRCFHGWFGLDCARLADPSIFAASPAPAAGTHVAAAAAAAGTGGGGGAGEQVTSGVDSVAAAERERQQQAGDAADEDGATVAATAAGGALGAGGEPFVPEHVRFMLERPHIQALVVDQWQRSAPVLTLPASRPGGNGAGTVEPSAAALAAAAAARAPDLPPPIPGIYSTPVNTWASEEAGSVAGLAGNGGAWAAAAAGPAARRQAWHQRVPQRARHKRHVRGLRQQHGNSSSGGKPQRHRGWQHWLQRHRLQQSMRQQAQRQQLPLLQQQEPGQGLQQQQQQLHQEPGHVLEQQQQQQQQQKEPPGFLRRLLRHFFTGGGSHRAELSLSPKQDTVAAAVHAWLSAAAGSARGGSGGGSAGHGGAAAAASLGGAGLAEALLAAGVPMHRLARPRDAALLQHMVEVALGRLPEGWQRRPRIFVYDMPSRFVSRLLQYRSSKRTCTWRVFSKSNFSLFTTSHGARNAWDYPLESHLHELLLQSPHRTLDPEEADFFYVPVYAACMMEAVAGWADAPWFNQHSKSHVKQGVVMYQEALDWIRTTHSYWNATGGADHIWLFAHDEGACWAPAEVYNASIILTQWGRLGPPSDAAGHASKHGLAMDSWTSKWTQDWTKYHATNEDPLALPEGADYQQLLVGHACYTPGKDLVLPTFRPPAMFAASPHLGGDARRGRDILLLLRGDLGAGRPATFSHGVRQRLARLAAEGDWRRRYGAWVGTPRQLPGDQSALLARARYCLVLPTDGWSGGFEDAVLHGCIPVVVSPLEDGGGGGGLAQPFSALLRISSGVIKVGLEDLPQLPDLLQAVPVAVEASMRAALGTWWHRMAWLTHPWVRAKAAEVVEVNLRKHPWVRYKLEEQHRARARAMAAMGRPPAPAAAAGADVGDGTDALLVPVLPATAGGGGQDGEEGGGGADGGSSDGSSGGGSDGAGAPPGQQGSSGSSDGALQGASGTPAAPGAAPQPRSEADAVAELFATRVWQPGEPIDDAFDTLMQWLHYKMLHPYVPPGAPAPGAAASHGVQPITE